MADILITDLATGGRAFIPEEEFDPAIHELESGQVATVAPVGGEGGFLAGQDVTPESLRGGLLPEAAPEAKAAQTREQVQGEFDTLGNTLAQGARGAAAGATFGVSELAITAGDDALEREQQRREREAGGHAFLAGEFVGAIVPGVLTGGTGTMATLGRLAPSARLANATAKVAARGGFRNAVASSAVEGAIGAVGEEIARQAIAEDPDFSAESLLEAAARGGAFGAAGGGIGALLSKAAARSATRLSAADAAEQAARSVKETAKAEKLTKVATAKAAKEAKALQGGLFATTGRRTNYKRVAGKRIADRNADAARDLGVKIDDLVAKKSQSEVDDLLARATGDLGEETAELARRASAAGNRFNDAADKAKGWFSKYADDVGLEGAKKRLTMPVSQEVEDAGIDALGDLDMVAKEYDDLAEELAARVGVERAPISAPQTELGESLTTGMRDRVAGRTGRAAGSVAGGAQQVLGAAELATSLGVEGAPTVRDVPGIGALLSGYLQLKAGSRLAHKIPGNWFRASAVTDAAEAVTSTRARIANSVRGAATKALKRVGKSKLPRITGAQLGARLAALEEDKRTAGRVAAELAPLGPDVQAGIAAGIARAADHLLETAPRPPVTGASLSADWRPDPADMAEWQLRVRAVENPLAVLQSAVTDPGRPGAGFEAVRAVYPAQWEAYRAGLDEQRDSLVDNFDDARLMAIGDAFALPLTVANLHTYGMPVPTAGPPGEAAGPDLRFSSPTQVTTSPMVTQEQTPNERRPR